MFLSKTWEAIYLLYRIMVLPSIWITFECPVTLAFSRKECLDVHNSLRSKHVETPSVRYSAELELQAQRYAKQLEETDDSRHELYPTRKIPKRRRAIPATPKFFHKEMWDGEVLFPLSKGDINRNKRYPVGQSIHKFCCFSYPYCPKEFFYQLDFPPSPSSVVQQWYNTEISNYDFKRGRKKKKDEEIVHFTNIVWLHTEEVGCAQSKRSAKGCVYTVVRYRGQGSVGMPSKFIRNVKDLKTNMKEEESDGNNTILIIFLLVALFLVLFMLLVIAYFKKDYIRSKYREFMIMRNVKRSQHSTEQENWWNRLLPCLQKKKSKNVIYKPSSNLRKPRPTIEVITDTSGNPEEDPLDQNPDVVYENLPKKSNIKSVFSKKARFERPKEQTPEESPARLAPASYSREPLLPKQQITETVPAVNGNPERVSTYVNVDYGPPAHPPRPSSSRVSDVPRKPLLPSKPQTTARPTLDLKPTPPRRPASDAILSSQNKAQSPQRHMNTPDDKTRPFPVARNKPRAESDTKALQQPEFNKLRKTASNEPSTQQRKPQPPRRPDSSNFPRIAHNIEAASPKENPGGRISEMKKMLGNQGVR